MAVLFFIKLVILSVLYRGSLQDQSCRKEIKQVYGSKFSNGLGPYDLQVTYDMETKCGDTVSDINARFAPTLKLDVTDRCVNVTVIEFSPDSTVFSPYLRWIAHNVPSRTLKAGFKNGGGLLDTIHGHNQGNVRCPYQIPTDLLSGAGIKNATTIIFFIYCQCHFISDNRLCIETDRQEFDVKGYAKRHGLKCPIAGFYHFFTVTGVNLPTVVKVDKVDVPVKLPKVKLPVNAPDQPDVPLAVPDTKVI